MTRITDIKKIKSKIEPLLGQKCWNPAMGHGSFLTFEFGKIKIPARPSFLQKKWHSLPASEIKEELQDSYKKNLPPEGEWHLWIYMCAWEILHNNQILANSEDGREVTEAYISNFDGLVLKSLELLDDSENTTFTFEDGYVLKTSPYEDEEEGEERWMLFCPDGYVLKNQAGNKWLCQSASEP